MNIPSFRTEISGVLNVLQAKKDLNQEWEEWTLYCGSHALRKLLKYIQEPEAEFEWEDSGVLRKIRNLITLIGNLVHVKDQQIKRMKQCR